MQSHAAIPTNISDAPLTTASQGHIPAADSLPGPSPDATSSGLLPYAEPGPTLQAMPHADLLEVQDSVRGARTPLGGPTGPIIKAVSVAAETLSPARGPEYYVGLSPSLDFHDKSQDSVLLIQEAGLASDEIAGSLGPPSNDGVITPLTKPAFPQANPLAGGQKYRAGTRTATVAPIRLWSKAAIHPYASQGIKCQGSGLSIVTSTGGTPSCMDIDGRRGEDGVQVWSPVARMVCHF